MTKYIANLPDIKKLNYWRLKPDLDILSVEQIPRELIVRKSKRPQGAMIGDHKHNWGQLLYASSGLMSANTHDGTWVIPPHRAVWIPAGILHSVHFARPTSLVNLYLSNTSTSGFPENCCIMGISPLLRELISEIAQFPTLYDAEGADGRLIRVFIDQLATVQETAFHLPLPQDKQLKKITDALRANPSDNCSLQQWANIVGSSGRTLARRFQKETALSFSEWRQQARLIAAVIKLADGVCINQIAEDLGYASQSAFTNMFRKATGKTPARYFNEDSSHSPIKK